MVLFYKIWKKYNEIELTKKMDLNNQKMTNQPPSPDYKTTAKEALQHCSSALMFDVVL